MKQQLKNNDELAKQAFLESQRQIEAQLKSTKEVDLTNTEPKKRFWKKRNLDHPKRADEDVIVVEKKVEEIVEIVKPVAQEQKQIEIDILDVDDWEQMIGENFEAKVTCEKTENLEINESNKNDNQITNQNENKNENESNQKTDKKGKKTDDKKKNKADDKKTQQLTTANNTIETIPSALSAFHNNSKFRCPIICIMGHVDTGKTKLLDHIRKTNVQGGEAGGITQQIGASFFPEEKLREEINKVDKKMLPVNLEIPGLLIIDTPGHESFANLRSRGSSLCDFAIVVIDVMHGVENQTIESIKMLQEKGTPFVIALNKIDRLYQWISANDQSSYLNFKKQSSFVQTFFNEKYNHVVAEMAKLDINIAIYWKKEDPFEYVPVVPTSAITGEGVPDLLGYIADFTQNRITEKIKKNENDFKATVLEVKKAEGVGATVDIIVVNGTLSIDDKIVLSGFDGPIKTFVKGLLTPHPMKEMRVKNEHLQHQKIVGSIGVRLIAPGLETAIAGSQVFRYNTPEECDEYSVELQKDIKRVKKTIKLVKEGVGVAASSLGSLEALLVFLKASKIPVSTICIGDVSKSDMLKVLTPFLQEDSRKKKQEYLTMLCFDVKILPEAFKFGEDNGIKMITAKIIYHLFDGFTKHVQEVMEKRKKEEAKNTVFPCVLKQVMIINKKDPIIVGVDVIEGVLKIGLSFLTKFQSSSVISSLKYSFRTSIDSLVIIETKLSGKSKCLPC